MHVLEAGERGELAPGTQVGEYRVEGKLGEGGMGVVYRGVQPLLRKPVAIKVLASHLAQHGEALERFLQEARAVQRIDDKRHIVDVFAFGQLPDGRLYCVMDLLEGQSLRAYLDDRHRLELGEAIAILLPVCDALIAAHQAGIVHRDLKPENVFLQLRRSGAVDVKLLDFGIAKLVEGDGKLTKTGAMLGTPAYMAPEQCQGGKVDARADLYALGVLAFELLTGRRPLDGEGWVETLSKKVLEKPVWPAEPRVPVALERTILASLAVDPAARPGDVAAFRAALGGITPGPAARARSGRTIPLVAAAAVLALGGAAAVYFATRPPAGTTAPRPAATITPPPAAPPAPAVKPSPEPPRQTGTAAPSAPRRVEAPARSSPRPKAGTTRKQPAPAETPRRPPADDVVDVE